MIHGNLVAIVANDATVKGGTYYPITVKVSACAHASQLCLNIEALDGLLWEKPHIQSVLVYLRLAPSAASANTFHQAVFITGPGVVHAYVFMFVYLACAEAPAPAGGGRGLLLPGRVACCSMAGPLTPPPAQLNMHNLLLCSTEAPASAGGCRGVRVQAALPVPCHDPQPQTLPSTTVHPQTTGSVFVC